MIAPLRKRHRLWITGLALLVPAVCALALWSRPPAPAGSGGEVSPVAAPTSASSRAIASLPGFRTAVRGGKEAAQLEVEALEPLRRPDVLLYFSATAPADTLPADAHLLGSVAHRQTRSFPLPTAAAKGGHLVLYSLAHQDVVASAALEAVPEAVRPAATEPGEMPPGETSTAPEEATEGES